ncbi:hypothetical protein OC845_002134 [Tilletia horrida]|nr:hypothetical protein OC845_002134 [Tilletia horrida]
MKGVILYSKAPRSDTVHDQSAVAVRGLDGAQARLLGGTLWLTTETLGLLMSTLRFKKNYERDVSLDHLAARGGKVPDPTWIEMGGKALAGIATLMAGVNLALSFSNAAMVPYTKPDKEHLRRSEKEDSHEELAVRSKFDAITRFFSVAMVGVSLLGFPMNIAMYQAMKPQHLSLHHND